MLDRQHGKFVVECNRCDEVLETETGDFQRARDVMKENHWRAHFNTKTQDWDHFCPDCK